MAIAIMLSTFGCCNGLILAGSRVYYAMAKDGLFFKSVAKLHPTYKTPAVSLMVQMVWTCILCVSGSYGQLLDYIIFAVLVFYILTIFGLFVLRRTRPDAERPYRAIGYPVLPAIYIVMALFIDVVLLRYKPQYTWPGLIIVLLGIPVYFLWSRRLACHPERVEFSSRVRPDAVLGLHSDRSQASKLTPLRMTRKILSQARRRTKGWQISGLESR